ncbi:MAG: multicopper oxidase domain-containing protein [Fluviicola sp.]|nr:multicopper oxidase domain-containing protein [Fluviicola sp.]
MKKTVILALLLSASNVFSQNPLTIPTTIETTTINLVLQEGITQFYPGINTNTMGANGALLGPTLIMNQGDNVNITVDNQLQDTTTIHWHGMHISPENDGGPHSIIYPGTTWNPQFTVLDKAGLYWYHPHLHMKTNEHVSKGIAGLIIVRDSEEAGLNLPQTYGVDEFPIVMQTKGFDASGQILIHTESDTLPMVNGTVDAFVDFPAQVVRLRVLNGSSQRTIEFGFSDNRSFSLIGTDGGLFTAPLSRTRYRISPGQRADILIDLTTSLGNNFQLMSFASELPNAIYGAAQPGMGAGATNSLVGYTANPLNGNNYQLLDITVTAQTASPVLTIPSTLATFTPIAEASANITRSLTFTSAGNMGDLNGPFLINGSGFDMGVINYTVPLDNVEIWSLTNQTPIAHPFHIHDVQFFILDINGNPPPPELQGYNDVVLVPGGQGNVRFIARFNDFSDPVIPFMYHCHMLTHEDMGMMGQFLVVNTASVEEVGSLENISVYPNPSENGIINIEVGNYNGELTITDVTGRMIEKVTVNNQSTTQLNVKTGVYYLSDSMGRTVSFVVR